LSEFLPRQRTRVLLYGPPKSGKTKLAGDLLKAGYTLDWFDLESGIKTITASSDYTREDLQRVNYFRVPDHKLYPIAIDTMKAVFRTASPKRICFEHGAVNCTICKPPAAQFSTFDFSKYEGEEGDKRVLVVDSLSQLAMSAIFKKVLAQIKGDNGDAYKFEWDDYNAQSNALTEILSKVQILPINCVFISHETDAEKAEGQELLVPQAGTRNYSRLVAKFFDEVVYSYRQNGKHRATNSTAFSSTVLSGGRGTALVEAAGGKPSLVPLFAPQQVEHKASTAQVGTPATTEVKGT
jgi:AAA domain